MLPYTQTEIVSYISKWFELNKNKPAMFSQDEIGKVLKTKISEIGHWKEKDRPKKKKKENDDDDPF